MLKYEDHYDKQGQRTAASMAQCWETLQSVAVGSIRYHDSQQDRRESRTMNETEVKPLLTNYHVNVREVKRRFFSNYWVWEGEVAVSLELKSYRLDISSQGRFQNVYAATKNARESIDRFLKILKDNLEGVSDE